MEKQSCDFDDEEQIDSTCELSVVPARQENTLDWSWIRKLVHIQRNEATSQYQLACLSTLGGGYFLCNKHKIALEISCALFQLGHRMGNRALMVRAMIYQAVNLKLLGYIRESKRIFSNAYKFCDDNEYLISICKSSELVSIYTCEIKTLLKTLFDAQWLEDMEVAARMKHNEP
jgi:hypothetical protein